MPYEEDKVTGVEEAPEGGRKGPARGRDGTVYLTGGRPAGHVRDREEA